LTKQVVPELVFHTGFENGGADLVSGAKPAFSAGKPVRSEALFYFL